MSTKSKSDISNSAIRMFLQSVGAYYDTSRGFHKFSKNKNWKEIAEFFDNRCCFCNETLNEDSATVDHLIPINKTSLGLHSWGNIVPSCRHCNKEKNSKDWKEFTKNKCKTKSEYNTRARNISRFQKKWKYNPNLNLSDIAQNLYDDVGEVSSVLIKLRLEQAQKIIHDVQQTKKD